MRQEPAPPTPGGQQPLTWFCLRTMARCCESSEPALVSPPALSISLVSFDPDVEVLSDVVTRLAAALHRAVAERALAGAELVVVDNGPREECRAKLQGVLATHWDAAAFPFSILSGHGNVGYGQGHNKAIERSRAEYHLIVNPDVLISEDAIARAIEFMRANPEVGLLAPAVMTKNGDLQHLCKEYPSVLDLTLRGFAPAPLRTLARKRLARYEMRHMGGGRAHADVPLVSGSFMLFRRRVLELTGGFSQDYFLYFEDFDLSLRAAEFGKICYVPDVRIEHKGGFAGRKGPRHWWMFGRSAYTFFSQHGWRWY